MKKKKCEVWNEEQEHELMQSRRIAKKKRKREIETNEMKTKPDAFAHYKQFQNSTIAFIYYAI